MDITDKFVDANFKVWVYNKIGKTAPEPILDSDVSGITRVEVYSNGISDLSGIEYFTALTVLGCTNNQLTALDVTKNTALTKLNCRRNQLTALDVSKNTALDTLICDNNQLTALDVTKNTALMRLDCYYNQLTALDVTKNTALTELLCYYNQLTALNVSKNTALTWLGCDYNQLSALDVSKSTALTYLKCDYNQLTALDVSKNTALKELNCGANQISALDVSKNTALTQLWCGANQLTALDVSKNTALWNLDCAFNNLTALDVSKNTALTELSCVANQLTTLDVSKNTALEGLDCSGQIRANYLFEGWYRDSTYTVRWDDNISTNLKLYAKWTYTLVVVTEITGVPPAIKINEQFPLTGTVVPEDAASKTIVWSVENAGTTGAGIYNGVFIAMSEGTAVLKATVANGLGEGVPYEQFFFINAVVSVASSDRVIPAVSPSVETSSVAPVSALSVGFAAGPNPVARSFGSVCFFRVGAVIKSADLSVYDASGNVVRRLSVKDVGGQSRRKVASWDLRDAGGRLVSAGSYLVRGAVVTKDGKREVVSAVVGVR